MNITLILVFWSFGIYAQDSDLEMGKYNKSAECVKARQDYIRILTESPEYQNIQEGFLKVQEESRKVWSELEQQSPKIQELREKHARNRKEFEEVLKHLELQSLKTQKLTEEHKRSAVEEYRRIDDRILGELIEAWAELYRQSPKLQEHERIRGELIEAEREWEEKQPQEFQELTEKVNKCIVPVT